MVSEGEEFGCTPEYDNVLILVLVEDGLGACDVTIRCYLLDAVLILVLVEDGLGAQYWEAFLHLRRWS